MSSLLRKRGDYDFTHCSCDAAVGSGHTPSCALTTIRRRVFARWLALMGFKKRTKARSVRINARRRHARLWRKRARGKQATA